MSKPIEPLLICPYCELTLFDSDVKKVFEVYDSGDLEDEVFSIICSECNKVFYVPIMNIKETK